jgi:hypothetical protein
MRKLSATAIKIDECQNGPLSASGADVRRTVGCFNLSSPVEMPGSVNGDAIPILMTLREVAYLCVLSFTHRL